MKLQTTLKPGQAVAIHVVRNQGAGRRAQPERYYLSGKLPLP
jgi:hypothetical protein